MGGLSQPCFRKLAEGSALHVPVEFTVHIGYSIHMQVGLAVSAYFSRRSETNRRRVRGQEFLKQLENCSKIYQSLVCKYLFWFSFPQTNLSNTYRILSLQGVTQKVKSFKKDIFWIFLLNNMKIIFSFTFFTFTFFGIVIQLDNRFHYPNSHPPIPPFPHYSLTPSTPPPPSITSLPYLPILYPSHAR